MAKIEDYFIDKEPISEINLDYFKKYLVNDTNHGIYSIDELLKTDNIIIGTRMNDLHLYQGKMPTLRSQRDGIYYVFQNNFYQLTGAEALAFQVLPLEKIEKVKLEVSNRHLLMQAGNAMSVNVIKELEKIITIQEESTMATWDNFEIEATRYLENKFGSFASFIHQGGADSTVPDIFVRLKSGKSFYIEAKHSPAQCGQFVLLPNIQTKSFIYSRKNANQKISMHNKLSMS